MKTIALCINSLDDNILPLFKKLAVLPDNVKISAKVLSHLWNKEITEVESILKKLRSKSLIIETYDREHKNYLYEIQEIIMNYLRSTTNDEDTRKLHSDFLNSYHYDNINTTSAEILDDGYIAYYIGYHILNTKNLNQKWALFNKLFLDLKFLGNKVRLTGPDDVMIDLQKYESYIAKDVSTFLMILASIYCFFFIYLEKYCLDKYDLSNVIITNIDRFLKKIFLTWSW